MLVGVDLADGDLVVGMGEGLAELFVDGGQALAVAAPGGEEFDQRGLVGLEDDVVEVLGVEVDHRGGGCRQEGEAAH